MLLCRSRPGTEMTERSWLRAALAGALVLPAPVSAAEGVLSFSVTAGTDYVFRGVSQTLEEPALQVGGHYEHPSGFFAGLWASTVDSPSYRLPRDTREVELDLYLGWGLELPGPWSLVASAVRYEYPVGDDDFDYDYLEGVLAVTRGPLTLSAAWSDDGLGFYGDSLALELVSRQPLPRRLELAAGLGRYHLGTLDESYLYWNLGLARRFGRFVVDLGYYDTDGTAERIWDGLAGARGVLAATYHIR